MTQPQHNIWLAAAICLLGLLLIESGLQRISRREKLVGVLGLLAVVGGAYLLWVAGLNVF
jgi:hypothetical protein